MERKAASAFFATPPESSYEEALGYMLNAAKHRDDWIRAAQQVGECYAKLNVRQTKPTAQIFLGMKPRHMHAAFQLTRSAAVGFRGQDTAKAKEWYEKTVGMECPEGSEEEKKAQEEAAAALKKL